MVEALFFFYNLMSLKWDKTGIMLSHKLTFEVLKP